ncbi:MAG: hypothetical protein JNK77_05605 [Saprospiraceae bacterium]|nr:hypothetical protein [Saprospiraceae bacterium]
MCSSTRLDIQQISQKNNTLPTNPLNDLFAPTSNHFLQPNGAKPAYHAEYPPKTTARTIPQNGTTMAVNIV